MTTTVIIADDHDAMRSVLRTLIDDEPDMRVVAEVADGDVAFRLVHEHRPDVLVADISMPGLTGIQLAASLRDTLPSTRVLIVTMHEEFDLVLHAMAAGAAGYLVKRRLEGQVPEAIRAVASGGTYFPHDLVSRPAPPANAIGAIPTDQLTTDDLELLRQTARARTRAQIAAELGVSPEVVENRQSELLRKLGLHTRLELIRYAHAFGFAG